MTRITVAQAAKELNMTVLAVRYFMQSGQLNIGYVMKPQGSQRATFYCFMEAVQAEKRRLNGDEKRNSGDGSDFPGIVGVSGGGCDSESDGLAEGTSYSAGG